MIAGVYKVTNLLDGRVYIGQSYNLQIRAKQHFGKSHAGGHSELYSDMDLFGVSNFSFEVLIETYDLDYWERFFIYWYDSTNVEHGYNRTTGGVSATVRTTKNEYTEISRAKMRDGALKRWGNEYEAKRIVDLQNVGKSTIEYRNKRREIAKVMWQSGKFAKRSDNPSWHPKGRKMSSEAKEKMKIAAIARETKRKSDFSFYCSNGGALNYREFCKHYKGGVNDLI